MRKKESEKYNKMRPFTIMFDILSNAKHSSLIVLILNAIFLWYVHINTIFPKQILHGHLSNTKCINKHFGIF